MAQDDSVLQYTPRYRQKIILRRARGYAPAFAGEPGNISSKHPVLALGADMKSTFAFTASGNTYVSQYLGDLSSYDNLLNFEHSLEQLTNLLDFRPALILTDKHPAYTSVRYGKELAQKLAVSCVEVPHHEAHFAAVLADNNLLECQNPVLGVIWDGTGLGTDGLIRGGEFLLFQRANITPLAQLEPFPHILADKMALEPRVAALALCHKLDRADNLLRKYFTDAEWKLYHKVLDADKFMLQTTSMGRVFDAAAVLIGLCSRNSYEGEAAMMLEAVASRDSEILNVAGYFIEDFDGKNIPVRCIFRQIIADVANGIPQERIAAKFHVTLVNVIESAAKYFSLTRIAFSGGVFQNSLLVDLILDKLSPRFQLYFHRQLPPNDECISFGQLSWMIMKDKYRDHLNELSLEKEKQYAVNYPLNY
jgi:hydrogenase maturation protein HypF